MVQRISEVGFLNAKELINPFVEFNRRCLGLYANAGNATTSDQRWTALWTQPLALTQSFTSNLLHLQLEYARSAADVMHGGVMNTEQVGELCNLYQKFGEQCCAEQLSLCEGVMGLVQRGPAAVAENMNELASDAV